MAATAREAGVGKVRMWLRMQSVGRAPEGTSAQVHRALRPCDVLI